MQANQLQQIVHKMSYIAFLFANMYHKPGVKEMDCLILDMQPIPE